MSWPGPRVFVLLRYGSALAWFGLAWPGWLGLARLGLAWLGRCGFGLGSAWLVSVAVALVWSQAKPLAPQFLSPLGGAWLVLVLGKMESGLAWLRFASLRLAWLGLARSLWLSLRAKPGRAKPHLRNKKPSPGSTAFSSSARLGSVWPLTAAWLGSACSCFSFFVLLGFGASWPGLAGFSFLTCYDLRCARVLAVFLFVV